MKGLADSIALDAFSKEASKNVTHESRQISGQTLSDSAVYFFTVARVESSGISASFIRNRVADSLPFGSIEWPTGWLFARQTMQAEINRGRMPQGTRAKARLRRSKPSRHEARGFFAGRAKPWKVRPREWVHHGS